MFLRTLQCIPHHTPPCHICTYIWFYFFQDGILVFWSHQEVLDSIASFKVNLHSMFTACFLYTFTDSFIVRNHHMWFLDVVARVLCSLAVIVGCGFGFHFHLVHCPCRIFTAYECLFQMFFFLLQHFRTGAGGFSSVMQWTYYTILWWYCVVTVPL